jgi:integrase
MAASPRLPAGTTGDSARKRPAAAAPAASAACSSVPLPRSRAELRACGPATRARYEKVVGEYQDYLLFNGLPTPDTLFDIEQSVLLYIDLLLDAGEPAHEAETAVAAIIDAMPVIPALAAMPRVKRALRGFRKARPARSRAPLSKELMAAFVQIFLAQGHVNMAVMMILMFYSYCRPGELRRAKRRQLLAPVRRKGPLSHWALVMAPQEDDPGAVQDLTKTGTMDDTIILDLPAWMPKLVAFRFGSLRPLDDLFPMSPATSVVLFKAACGLLGLPRGTCMYQMRHGGASEDLLSHSRPQDDVKRRGRWSTDSSLRRYAKPAQVQRLLGSLAPEKLSYALDSWEHLEALIFQRVVPRLP